MSGSSRTRRAVIETLNLPRQSTLIQESPILSKCFLCDEEFEVGDSQRDIFLSHAITKHKLVIGDVGLISDLTFYVAYWRKRFSEGNLTDFCSVIETNTGPRDTDPREFYYLLCDNLPEDRKIREELNNTRLEIILEYQEHDRSRTDFSQMCIFCSTEFFGGFDQVVEFFNHMNSKHQFNVGHPDNMVFIDEFIETIRTRLDSLQCLSCVKYFKDRSTLKDHMRKKSHRALNKDDRSFDKFYLINYLEIGKRWTHLAKEPEPEEDETGWEETNHPNEHIYCFFCEEVKPTFNNLLSHLYDAHDFEYQKIKDQLKLSFYEQLKLINWIRLEKHHLGELDVMEVTERILNKEWNFSQYYFPTFQNDAILHFIELDDKIEHEDNYIYPEDLADPAKIRRESVLKDLLSELRHDKVGKSGLKNRQKKAKSKPQNLVKNKS